MSKERVAVISDIHSNFHALEALESKLETYDKVLCLGDLVGYGAFPNEVIRKICEKKWVTVIGNHDLAVIEGDTSNFNPVAAQAIIWTRKTIKKPNLEFIERMEFKKLLDVGDITLGMFHGSPYSVSEYIFPLTPQQYLKQLLAKAGDELGVRVDILLLGHTHIPMAVKCGNSLVLNPGSVGQPRDRDPRASYMELIINGRKAEYRVIREKYPVEEAAKSIIGENLPVFNAERLFFGC
ncbi:MAG: metallophosphoesterase [Methanobacteriota archaeon]|nr:MAG: metallophosphoesterase [Euryarchaeota archaeon]